MQQTHFTVTDTPADIATIYLPGRYLAQLATFAETPHGVLYATAMTAPPDDPDYFRCNLSAPLFEFSTVAGLPTWVKTSAPGLTFTLAVAQIGN
jgi:hypothetical protein